jgi:hypothetical protein
MKTLFRILFFLSVYRAQAQIVFCPPGAEWRYSVFVFAAVLDNGDSFGISLAALADLNGDAVADLAAGASQDDDGGTDRGAVYVLFMASTGL